MTHPQILEGQLITLEKLQPYHLNQLEKIATDPTIWQNLPVEGWRKEVFDSWANTSLAAQQAGAAFLFAIFENKTGDLIGTTRFQDMDAAHRKTDIGWTWFTPSVWGRGFNFESKKLMLSQAFEVWEALRVGFKVDERNRRSQRALEKTGALQEGYIRKHMLRPDGSQRNSFLYGITDDDWFSRAKMQLQQLVLAALIAAQRGDNPIQQPESLHLLKPQFTGVSY